MWELWDNLKQPNTYVIGGPEGQDRGRKKGFKNYGQTFLKFNESYKPTKPNSIKPKTKKHKQTYAEA